MPRISGVAATAALVGDPARASMLLALMDGRALTAGELARAAGVAPQTASGHLAQLTGAGLLAVQTQGRHRYHRVASESVARMLESIMEVSGEARPPVFVGPRDRVLRRLRTCFDHLAGEIAVAMAARMVARGQLELSPDGGALTASGADFLAAIGADLTAGAGRRSMFCRPCLDWSERRLHLAGTVGAALCTACLFRGWMRRMDGTRALTVTPLGETGLREAFGALEAG